MSLDCMSLSQTAGAKRASMKMFIKRQVRTVHWMSGALSLVGMMLFAATGITLNHARDLTATPKTVEGEIVLPKELTAQLDEPVEAGAVPGLPPAVTTYLKSETGLDTSGRPAEWSDLDVYVSLPRPGGDAWISIDRDSGEVLFEQTSRGAVAYLNDLHKGRNTGFAWSLFLDLFAVAAILFCASGLWLLQMHSARRPSTWPLTIAGFALPVLLLLLFTHA
ncbi:MAG: PepSY-associated TM helix domain-containing protein [Hyphomonas sp.]|nr:PepSY-associated TM helix domain-containing protein [Hyphomonas sp.]